MTRILFVLKYSLSLSKEDDISPPSFSPPASQEISVRSSLSTPKGLGVSYTESVAGEGPARTVCPGLSIPGSLSAPLSPS